MAAKNFKMVAIFDDVIKNKKSPKIRNEYPSKKRNSNKVKIS